MEPKEGPPPTSPCGGGAGGGGGGAEGGSGGALRLGAKTALGTGSATTTVVAERVQEPQVLRLVLEPRPHVRWDEGVVDNEHMNKKSSKRCCIFHKKRAFGESSSESESDDEGDADGGGDGQGAGGGGDKDRHMRIAQPKHPPVRPWETYHA